MQKKCKNNAISFLKTASEKGNCYASYLLGLHYANDKCEKHDFNNAKSYFQRATDQGNSNGLNAKLIIGLIHLKRRSIGKLIFGFWLMFSKHISIAL